MIRQLYMEDPKINKSKNMWYVALILLIIPGGEIYKFKTLPATYMVSCNVIIVYSIV